MTAPSIQPPPGTATAGAQLAENGRVLATLDDWRAIMFVLIGVIVILILLIVWLFVANSRRDGKIADAMDKLRGSLDSLTVEIRVMRGLATERLTDATHP